MTLKIKSLVFCLKRCIFHESVFPFHTITLQDDVIDSFLDLVLPTSPNFSGIPNDLNVPDSQMTEANEVLPSLPNTNVTDCNALNGVTTPIGTNVHSSTHVVDVTSSAAAQPSVVATDVQISSSTTADVPSRRSSQVVKQPSYLWDYHRALLQTNPLLENDSKFPLHKVLSYDKLSAEFQKFVLTVSSVYEPQFYHQAIPFLALA